MKSLEHIIREIREGKGTKAEKKSLEHSIRKVVKGEAESSFADRTTKPLDEDVGGLVGSGTGGEPKLHAEDGKKKKTDEAVGAIGTDKYQGNQFKSVRSSTPHITPPGPAHGHSQAPENVSRQRSLAKEKGSMTLHGKVTEQAAAVSFKPEYDTLPKAAAGLASALSPSKKLKWALQAVPKAIEKGTEISKAWDTAEKAAAAAKAAKLGVAEPVEAPPKVKPKHDEPVEAPPGAPTPVKQPIGVPKPKIPDATPGKTPVTPPKPDIGQPEAPPAEKPKTPTAPPVTVPRPKPAEAPPAKPAIDVPMPKAPKPGVEVPPPYKIQPQQPAEVKPKEKEAPATKPSEPVKLPDINIPGAKPKTEPATKTDTATETKTRVAQLPDIDIVSKTATKTATQTATAADTATKSATDTTTSKEEEQSKKPSFGMGLPSMIDTGYAKADRIAAKVQTHYAKKHRSHGVHENIETRKQLENMPRKGDRKSIEYVGRSDANPKTAKEKTSRLATIKNVIDEAKKIKVQAEYGKEKKFEYPNGTEIVIGPNMKRNFLDVEDKKLPKDYDNK